MDEITGVVILSTVSEALVEYFAAPLMEKYGAKDYIRYIAAAVGIGLCVVYKVDVLLMAVGLQALHPVAGWVLSGLLIGRGSNFLNDLISRVRGGYSG